MLTSLALGAVTGVLTAGIIIAIAVAVSRYRKWRRLEEIKRRHYGGLMPSMYPGVENRKRKPARVETESNTYGICNGVMQVNPQPVQLPNTEPRLVRAKTVSQDENWPPFNEHFMLPARYQMRRGSSLINLPTAAEEDSQTSLLPSANCAPLKCNKPSICKSTNCIFPPGPPTPTRKPKKSKPSHSRVEPEYFLSVAEAMQSTFVLKKHSGENFGNVTPEIVLSLLYDKSKAFLTLTVLCVTGLHERLSNSCEIYVQGLLRPKYHKKQVTRSLSPSDGQFNECFYFGQVWRSDLDTSHLLLTVHKTQSNKKVAERFLMLALLKIESGKTVYFKLPMISESRNRRKSTFDKLMEFELGQVLIWLDFQNNKLKVVVYKAKKLPKTDSLPFRPDYQVIIELYQRSDHQVLETKLSGIQAGENPTWNEAFCFILPSSQLHDFYIDFTVVEKRRLYPNDVVIGHILLGTDGTSNLAMSHWNNCVSLRRMEEGKWHSVLPVIKY